MKKIVEGMTAKEVSGVIDHNFGEIVSGKADKSYVDEKLKNIVSGSVSGYKYLTSTDELPTEQTTIGYIIGNDMYLYVGEGGNTLSGLYQNVGPFKGEKGDAGERGADGIQGEKGEKGDKGEAGITSATIAVDDTTGIPSASVSIENQVLHISLSGIKGEQGNSGYQGAAGELEVVNNLIQGGATSALSAEQGKILGEELFGVSDGSTTENVLQIQYNGSTNAQNISKGFYYTDDTQNLFRGKQIVSLTAKISSAGTLSVVKAKGVGVIVPGSFTYELIEQFNVSTGIQNLNLSSPIILGNDEYLGVCVSGDTALFSYNGTSNGSSFYWIKGTSWSISSSNLEIGVTVSVPASKPLRKEIENNGKSIDGIVRTLNLAGVDFFKKLGRGKLAIIGDSISTFDLAGYKIDGYRMYYPSGTVTSVGMTYWKRLLDEVNAEIDINASYSGSCVTNVRASESYPNFSDRVSLLDNPQLIVVALGTNDSTRSVALGNYDYNSDIESLSDSTFRSAYIKGIKKLKQLYPSAYIYCLSMNMGDDYKESIKNIAKELSVSYIDCSGYDSTDNIHPTAQGMAFIADKIKSYSEQPRIDIVNNLTDGGTDKALSAEMGKQLGAVIYGGERDVVTNINQDNFTNEDYNIISSSTRGVISVDISDADEYTATVNVKEDSPFKFAIHTTNKPLDWGSYIADTGWITAGKSRTVDKSFGSASYLRFATTNSSTNVPPTLEELKQNVTISFTKKAKKNVEGVEKRFDGLEERVNSTEDKFNELNELLGDIKPARLELSISNGYALNSFGAGSSKGYELVDYVDVSKLNNVRVVGGFWNSDDRRYSTIIELYDAAKTSVKKIIPSELIGITNTKYAYVFDGVIDVSEASFMRFSNIVSTPSSNSNTEFKAVEAIVSTLIEVKTKQVVDEILGKTQEELNTELLNSSKDFERIIFGDSENIGETVVTQEELTEDDYSSTSAGGGRGFFNFPIEQYIEFYLKISTVSDSPIKVALTIKRSEAYGDNIYDSTWLSVGTSKEISNQTTTDSAAKYAAAVFTYVSGGKGIPTVDEIKQYVSIEFKGIKINDYGLVGKVADLEKEVFQQSSEGEGYKYQGEKVSFKDNIFTSKVIGTLSSTGNSRQGGAVFGDYLFQFHNTLENIVVYNLKTNKNVQTLTLTPISNHHAGSGGFGNEYYDSTDQFPILFISSMNEKKVYAYRITGSEGSWSIEMVQTISLDIDFYVPNVAIDRENNMMVIFGYTKNSWSESNNNPSHIVSCPLPKIADGDITISEWSHGNVIPYIYAQQGAFARFGKLYLSYGNTDISPWFGGAYVIDYVQGIVVSHIDFKQIGSFEPEAFCLYEGNIIMTGQNGNIYKLMF